MAEFDDSKVITALHVEDGRGNRLIGKEFYFSNSVEDLKREVKGKRVACIDTLQSITQNTSISYYIHRSFVDSVGTAWRFIYPYTRLKKKSELKTRFMTEEEIIEWWENSDCKVKEIGTNNRYMVDSVYYENHDYEDTFYIDVAGDSFTLNEFCNTFTELDGSKFEKEVNDENN